MFVSVDMTRVLLHGFEEFTRRDLEECGDLHEINEVALRSALMTQGDLGLCPSANLLHLFDLDHEFSALQC